MSRASDDILDELHRLTAEQLRDIIENGTPVYEDGELIGYEKPSPAYFAQAIKFLKDNGIEALRKPGGNLDHLANSMPSAFPEGVCSDDVAKHLN